MNKQELSSAVDATLADDPYDTFAGSLVSPRHKYVWISMAKVASVTTIITLRKFEDNPLQDGDPWKDEGVLKLCDFATDEIVEMLTSPEWCRFTFVRNPYDRLFSAYKSKISDPDGDPWYHKVQAEIREMFDYPCRVGKPLSIVSFRDFVRYVQGGGRSHDPHWCIQTKRLAPEMISYDFIGRYETYQRDFKALLKRLGAPPEVVTSAEKVHGQSMKICLPAAYDRELADTVYSIYKDDFEAFGYDRDSWMFQ